MLKYIVELLTSIPFTIFIIFLDYLNHVWTQPFLLRYNDCLIFCEYWYCFIVICQEIYRFCIHHPIFTLSFFPFLFVSAIAHLNQKLGLLKIVFHKDKINTPLASEFISLSLDVRIWCYVNLILFHSLALYCIKMISNPKENKISNGIA